MAKQPKKDSQGKQPKRAKRGQSAPKKAAPKKTVAGSARGTTISLDRFWELVQRSRALANATKDHAETLVEMLAEMEVEEIIEFERHLFIRKAEAYRNDLWLACYLLSGGYASDDGFKDFRSYLIAGGRKVFESAIRDPDSLADLVPLDEEAPGYEVFAYTASYAYKKKTGRYFEEDGIDDQIRPKGFVMWELTRPDGEPLTFADADTFLPKLKQRFDRTMRRRLSAAKKAYRSADPGTRRSALWDFYHFSAHSAQALAMLQRAEKDEDGEVRQQAKEYLEYYHRTVEQGG
jgi:hypothetical protein